MPHASLIHGILLGIGMVFVLYSCFIEYLKWQGGERGFAAFKDHTRSYFIRRLLFSLLLVVFLLLYFLGNHVFSFEGRPLLFVLYWWGTFTLLLLIFFLPALDLRELLMRHFAKRSALPAREGQEDPFFLHFPPDPSLKNVSEEEGEKRGPDEPFSRPGGEGSDPNPTLH